MIKPVATVHVVPDLPQPIARLSDLAHNLRWSWDADTIALFRRLDPDLWEETYHNPVLMLGRLPQEALKEASTDPAFLTNYQKVTADFDAYIGAKDTWFRTNFKHEKDPVIAYFSMEYGLTEALKTYSGGLGILSGDHLKSASDLGLPLVGIGLLYQEGYFQQYLNADGYQQETYPINDVPNLPLTLVRDSEGKPLRVTVPLPGRQLHAQVWLVQVGRIPLYLLDSNIPANPRKDDRNITDRLYGGDRRQRIRQEVLMGIGGIRLLEALNLRPTVCHMNEGHSTFMALERIRIMMQESKITFQQALELTRASNLFTTHTPVPAGLERFGYDLIDEHFSDYWGLLGLTRDQFHDLGRERIEAYDLFSMAVLALRVSADANGVAELHGVVSREMWQWMFPNVPEEEVPIASITNGIHVQTWVSREMATLFDRYLDPSWRTDEDDSTNWANIHKVPDAELWRTHERRRERLVAFARTRLREQLIRRGAPQSEIDAASEVLDPDALTIGFARRFATYKRATLLFRDLERFKRIVGNPERPVQFIFAGKAHPHDEEGKAFIRRIVQIARDANIRAHLVFLENYDMLLARYLVQGVDVWLNNPRRPKEASGTSGMKVVYNGGLNFSTLDGWWAEAYKPEVGWAIGNGEEYSEAAEESQDYVEAEALLSVLEQDIVPQFYDRARDGLPRAWIQKVKQSIEALAPVFNTRRMVKQYAEEYYLPEFMRAYDMSYPNLNKGLAFAAWRSGIEQAWKLIRIQKVDMPSAEVKVGEETEVRTVVALGQLKPNDVSVQLYVGPLNTSGEIVDGEAIDMQHISSSKGEHVYTAKLLHADSGQRGVSVRVVPKHEYLPKPILPNLITWA
ncbi:MAG: alpha-glucan family phosphorylase [Anaerolineae bacterium]|jgi:starch phosphorylase|nr:alpha-glucan family phosphorylase [Anaerolineae bacterium]